MKYTLTLLTLLISAWTMAQSGNPTFHKLIMLNEKGEVLLVEFDGEWEIPGGRYKADETQKSFLNSLAALHGQKPTQLKLNGVITFHHDNRERPTSMMYYSSVVKTNGESKRNIKWMPIKEALEIIPYQEMVEIVKHVSDHPNETFGGAMRIIYNQNQRTGEFKWIEPFYSLNN